MKKIGFSLITVLMIILSTSVTKAQAWDKSSKVLSIGIGGAYFYHFGNYSRYRYTDDFGNKIYGNYGYGSSLTGQFTFQGEFGVHKYVGVGFTTGLGGRGGGWLYNNSGEVNWPIGAIANFHFYQLIQDKTGKNIHADKLDIYAGANIGTGLAALFFGDGTSTVVPIIFGGPQVGIRYYFTPHVAVNGELGYGKTWVNAGMSFKL